MVMDPRDAARLVLSDPRTSTELAPVVGRSTSWIRHVRTGRLYGEIPRPEPTPWKRNLTADEVLGVRMDPRPSPVVAAELGVAPNTISAIRRGVNYPDGPWPERMPEWPRGEHSHAEHRPTEAPPEVRRLYVGQGR